VITGRFAPSPTGELHLGNLRTALAAWMSAHRGGPGTGRFLVRFEDLDRVTSSAGIAAGQLADLAAIGVVPEEPPVFQSDRFDLYDRAIDGLIAAGLTYPCFCTRREIREAAQAPHGGQVAYPGTCRALSPRERARRAVERPGAVRLNTEAAGLAGAEIAFSDALAGTVSGPVDDVVLRRNDGVPAYNVAVVVDDAAQGVTEVVRGDDLLEITPTQVALQRLLGLPTPAYVHVPLVYGEDGERLAKRHGAVTLSDLAARGTGPDEVRRRLVAEVEAWNLDGKS
jgi:glutamyl-tRNA synthetase